MKPPRSNIEEELGDLLAERYDNIFDTCISWVRSHIGIKRNEKADELAAFASALGPGADRYRRRHQISLQSPTF